MVVGVTALLSEKVKNEIPGMIPGRRLGTTEEVSHAVAFLAAEVAGLYYRVVYIGGWGA